MNYEIKGGSFPVVECYLSNGESMKNERGSMVWMSNNMKMETSGGGIGKMFSKVISGESAFSNTYTAQGDGYIAFGSSFSGEIIAIEINSQTNIILQKGAYLAASAGVNLDIVFNQKLGAGFFGGEGFIMQKVSGNGILFAEIDGSVIKKTLAPGEEILIDTGYLAAYEGTCKMDIRKVGGIKNSLLGGEGLFNTVVTGPGTVWLQTMPIPAVASTLSKYLPQQK